MRSDAYEEITEWHRPNLNAVLNAMENAEARSNVLYWEEVDNAINDSFQEIVMAKKPVGPSWTGMPRSSGGQERPQEDSKIMQAVKKALSWSASPSLVNCWRGCVCLLAASFSAVLAVACGAVPDATALPSTVWLKDFKIRDLVISPTFYSDNTIFAGTQSQGVFRSTDGGNSWHAMARPDGWPVGTLAISPTFSTDKTLFAGTSDNIYRSNDSGNSWQAMDSHPRIKPVAIVVSSTIDRENVLFAGTSGAAAFRSIDGGNTWEWITTTPQGLGPYIWDLAFSPTFDTDNSIFAAGSGGVFYSSDTGKSWHPIGPPIKNVTVYTLALSPAFDTDNTIYAGTRAMGVLRSKDLGDTWQEMSNGLTSPFVYDLALSPTFDTDNTIFASTKGGVFRSTDGGDVWHQIGPPIKYFEVFTIALSPVFNTDNTLFIGTGRGVLRSTDGGDSW